MATLSSWLWGSSGLDEAVDKATSELLPTGADDMALNLEICDQIRAKSVPAKDAVRALKRRLNHKNPNVQLLALTLTDVCIKNGGDHFLVEVASREFMDNLVSILKVPALNPDVMQTILRYVQNWSTSFEGRPTLAYVCSTYDGLVKEGYQFPPRDPTLLTSSSAMISTSTAPDWTDSDLCMRCRDAFSFTNRKHHCRNCGLVFDQKCSSKSLPLPHFGLTQDVRVCDGCYNKVYKKSEANGNLVKPTKHGHRHTASLPANRNRADADLQRAIQLSLQDAGGYSPSPSLSSSVPNQPFSEPPIVDRTTRPEDVDVEDDPDLKAAIEASLREAAERPSAPLDSSSSPSYSYSYSGQETPRQNQYQYQSQNQNQEYHQPPNELDAQESDVILTFSQHVEAVHRGQGGLVPGDHELYDRASALRPKLALGLDEVGRKEDLLTDMHGKLSEAVKLYDKLLTEQLSQPRWRQPQPQQQPPTQEYQYQYQQQPETSYQPSYQQQQYQYQYQPETQQQQQGYQPSYPDEMTMSAPQPPVSQSQYASAPTPASYASAPSPASYASAPPPASYASAPTPASYASAPTPASYAPQYSPPTPQYASAPPPPASYAPTPAPASYAPPVSLSRQNTYASPPPQPAREQYASPPPQPQMYASPPPQPAREQYASPPPSRQYTSPPSQPYQQPHSYQQQQHQPAQSQHPSQSQSQAPPHAQAQTVHPAQFPVAPTLPVAAFPSAPSTVPVPIPEREREREPVREALLIDL